MQTRTQTTDDISTNRAYSYVTQQKTQIYNWRFVYRLVMHYKRQLVWANVFAVVAGIAAVPMPMLLGAFVDQVALNQPGTLVKTLNNWLPYSWQGAIGYALAILGIILTMRSLVWLANLGQARIFSKVGKALSADIRAQLFLTLSRQPLYVFEEMGSGQIVNYFTTDVETIENFFAKVLGNFLYSVLISIGVLSVVFWMNWQLMLYMLITNLLVLVVGKVCGKRAREYRAKQNRRLGDFQANLTETLDAIHQLRATDCEHAFYARMDVLSKKVRDASMQTNWFAELVSRTSNYFMLSSFDIFRCIAVLLVVFSGMTIGEVLAVFTYLWVLMGAMDTIFQAQQQMYNANAALARLRLFSRSACNVPTYSSTNITTVETTHTIDNFSSNKGAFPSEKTIESKVEGMKVKVQSLCFRYKPNTPVLNNLDMSICAGEWVGLVGRSGCGKSTLVQLLLGLYLPDDGSICIDDIALARLSDTQLRNFRRQVSLVMQFPALMNDTIANNLQQTKHCSTAQLHQALHLACFDRDLATMPHGLHTNIGRGGVQLSGGQRQRLALARVFLQPPRLLILDEATSAQDTQTESVILSNLTHYAQHATVLMVAHRLSTLRAMHRLIVMDDGTIIEQGTHQQLIDNRGLYSNLAHFAHYS